MTELKDPSVKITIQLKARWLPFFVIMLVILQQIFPDRVWMALSTVFSLVWLLAYFWVKNLAAGLRIVRDHKYGWTQVGDIFEERIQLENKSIFPALWLTIEDGSTLIGHTISLGTGLGGLSSRRWMKRTACRQRGEYQLGPTTIFTGDVFGIYRVEICNPEILSFVVAPPAIKLPAEIQIATGLTIHDSRSMHRKTEKSNVSVSTREFSPGDSLKRIHWLITAKEDVPHVRLFENIHSSNACWIVLDLHALSHSWEEGDDSVEQSIILAASLANRFLIDGLAVGLLSWGSEFVLLPPSKGRAQFRQVQKKLATIQPGDVPLQKLLSHAWPQLSNEGNLVIITPAKGQFWFEQLHHLKRRHIQVTAFLLQTINDLPDELELFGKQLERHGIRHFQITPELFKTKEISPGRRGVVNWRYTPLGRAIKVMAETEVNKEA